MINKIKNKLISSNKKELFFLLFFSFLFFIIYLFLSILPHFNLHTNSWDLGIFNQALYQYSHLQLGPNTIRGYPSLLGDHSEFLMLFLSPLYYLFGSYTLLLIQFFSVIIGALGLYFFIKNKTTNLFLSKASFVFILSFFGTIQAISFDYHNDVLAFAILPWMLLKLEKRNINQFYIFLILFLLTKEIMAIAAFFVGLSLFFFDKKNKKHGIITAAVSIIYYLIVIKIFIPYFSGGNQYDYWYYDQLGKNIIDALKNIITNPLILFDLLINDPIKLKTIILILISGGFFLFLKPKYGLIFLPFLLMKMYANTPRLWETSFQYLIVSGIPLSMAIFTYLKSIKNKKIMKILTISTLASAILISLMIPIYNNQSIHKTISTSFNEIKEKKQNRLSFREAKKILPDDKKICCQSNLCPHLESKKIYNIVHENNNCDYIIINKNITWNNDPIIINPNLTPEQELNYLKTCRSSSLCKWKKFSETEKNFLTNEFNEKIKSFYEEGFSQIFNKNGIEIFKNPNPSSWHTENQEE